MWPPMQYVTHSYQQLALGDLGSNFGVDDAKYAGASGAQLLSESHAKVTAGRFCY